jgi:hypothetical protein
MPTTSMYYPIKINLINLFSLLIIPGCGLVVIGIIMHGKEE